MVQYCFYYQEGGLLLLGTAVLWFFPLYPENMEDDKTFFDQLINSFVGQIAQPAQTKLLVIILAQGAVLFFLF